MARGDFADIRLVTFGSDILKQKGEVICQRMLK